MGDETRPGRPRSEHARTAVLHAVDDLLVDVGYAALTMKGIAERAGVGRQTVYRWWSTKAEVLFEATVTDAERELSIPVQPTTAADVAAYLDAVLAFLTTSPAGAGYRALVGEAQQDPAVAAMMRGLDLFDAPAVAVLDRAVERGDLDPAVPRRLAVDVLTGPLAFRVLTGGTAPRLRGAALAPALLAALRVLPVEPARTTGRRRSRATI